MEKLEKIKKKTLEKLEKIKKKKFYRITKKNYEDYKEEIEDYDIDNLNFMRIELQSKIYPVDSTMVYISLSLAFASFLFNSTVINTMFNLLSNGDYTLVNGVKILIGLIIISLSYNFYKSIRNRVYKAKIEIIKLRLEVLKQKEAKEAKEEKTKTKTKTKTKSKKKK
ncbi:hypothetical protein [Clostridium sardiniense]|uniref:hypothetical protein n=1 Tax=Clostridium sardiniense TaxID=29369 RepID=UPI00195C5D84|nr:hypothetical protein [Clostridium sardiniense]MBM7835753.1 hypothetical protein [Clostridium sardiniense]